MNNGKFSIMLACAHFARRAKPVRGAIFSRLPAIVSPPTCAVAVPEATSTCTKARTTEAISQERSGVIVKSR